MLCIDLYCQTFIDIFRGKVPSRNRTGKLVSKRKNLCSSLKVFQSVSICLKSQTVSKYLKVPESVLKCLKVLQSVSNFFKVSQSYSKYLKMSHSVSKW